MNTLKKLFVGFIALSLTAVAFSDCMSPEERMKQRIQEEKENAWNKVKQDLCSDKPLEWKNALKEMRKLAEQGNPDALNIYYYLSLYYLDPSTLRSKEACVKEEWNDYIKDKLHATWDSRLEGFQNYLYYRVYNKEKWKYEKRYFIPGIKCCEEMLTDLRQCAMDKKVPLAERLYCKVIQHRWVFRRNGSAGPTAFAGSSSWHRYIIQGGDYSLSDLIELDKRNVDVALDALADVVLHSGLQGFTSRGSSDECVNYFFKKYFNEKHGNPRAIQKMANCILLVPHPRSRFYDEECWSFETKVLGILETLSNEGNSDALEALLGLVADPELNSQKRYRVFEALLRIKNELTVKEKYPQMRARISEKMKKIQKATNDLGVYEYIEKNFLDE
ncbi:MAG: hypothetical protein ACI4P6_00365 [Candidatus Spyradosoma sp.]